MISILSLNINHYDDKHGTWEARKPRIAELLVRLSPDIVCLQAVGRREGVLEMDQGAELAEAAGYSGTYFRAGTKVTSEGQSPYVVGSAFLSKGSLGRVTSHLLPHEPGDEDITQRMVLRLEIGSDTSVRLNLFNAHFSWIESQNVRDVENSIPILAAVSGPAIVCGDFNAAPQSPGLIMLQQNGWADSWPLIHSDRPGFTFESHAPSSRIDYVIANEAARGRVRSVEVVPQEAAVSLRLSDHLGLFAIVAL